MVSAENRQQREHEVAMAERGECHSAMLQTDMSKTLAAIKEAQQQAQVNNLQAMMTFQANLLKSTTYKR